MSRAYQIERAMEREEHALLKDFEDGLISRAEYNEGLRDLQRELQDAYRADQEDALARVREEWGG